MQRQVVLQLNINDVKNIIGNALNISPDKVELFASNDHFSHAKIEYNEEIPVINRHGAYNESRFEKTNNGEMDRQQEIHSKYQEKNDVHEIVCGGPAALNAAHKGFTYNANADWHEGGV